VDVYNKLEYTAPFFRSYNDEGEKGLKTTSFLQANSTFHKLLLFVPLLNLNKLSLLELSCFTYAELVACASCDVCIVSGTVFFIFGRSLLFG
jgi:hypothetical protein